MYSALKPVKLVTVCSGRSMCSWRAQGQLYSIFTIVLVKCVLRVL